MIARDISSSSSKMDENVSAHNGVTRPKPEMELKVEMEPGGESGHVLLKNPREE